MAYLPNNRLTDIFLALKAIFNAIVRPLWVDPTTGKINVNTVASITAGTINTVSTVTSMTQMAGFDLKQSLLTSQDRNAWGATVRNRIS